MKMPRYGHSDAIFFFKTSGGVLRGSRGVIHDPEAESDESGYKMFDRKSRFSLENLKNIGRWHISKRKSTFSVEIFVSSLVLLGLWDMSNTSATS